MAAGRGDRDALTAFIRATQRDVHRFLGHLVNPREADDLAQETYLRALGSLHRFAGRAGGRTWLLSIARRVAADHLRAAGRRPRTNPVDDWDDVARIDPRPAAVRSGVDEGIALRALIETLDTDRREAFVLTQLLDLSYAETAEVCGCPIGTIRSRVARAREDLVTGMRAPAEPERRISGA
nr:sigma-70 family RNA polymerase sigma factor [Pseudonocardia acidicola]